MLKTISKEKIYNYIIFSGCMLACFFMLLRCFFGTELTDEAYYISDAIAMVNGNIPFAYNNYSYATGAAFLLIPQIALYELFVPNNEGIVLFSRLSFMIFSFFSLGVIFYFLRKNVKLSNALLYIGILIPFSSGLGIYNYSYNTISTILTLLVGFILFDTIENKNQWSKVKIVLSGFLMGIVVFAHPVYIIVVLLFGIIIFQRTDDLKRKIKYLSLFYFGGLIEILIVMIPIIIKATPTVFIAGLINKIYPYPVEKSYHGSILNKVQTLLIFIKKPLLSLSIGTTVIALFAKRYICENQKKLPTKYYILFGYLVCLIVVVLKTYKNIGIDFYNWRMGFWGFLSILLIIPMFVYKEFPILIYIGLYPLIIPIVLITFVDSGASITRFVSAVPAFAAFVLFMLEQKSELIKTFTTFLVIIVILFMGLADYKYIYRDKNFSALRFKVQEGVYKGIYTSKERAIALPEFENFLNSVVNNDDYYAFRDNVPAGYLMMHKGKMCDRATWDNLNYSYHKNSPANLYAYYKRRGIIPTTIIYVDFGIDKQLSIEDDTFKYNEFVKMYYKKVDDRCLNNIFKHIIIYKYNDGFDGNFDYWINRHMTHKVEKNG